MKVKIVALLMACHLLYYPYILSDSEDRIVDAIESSDPDALRDLLIPGFLIRLEDKKRYVNLAQERTNATHAQLNKFKGTDLLHCAEGAAYLGIGLSSLYLALDFFIGKRDWRMSIWRFGHFGFAYFGTSDTLTAQQSDPPPVHQTSAPTTVTAQPDAQTDPTNQTGTPTGPPASPSSSGAEFYNFVGKRSFIATLALLGTFFTGKGLKIFYQVINRNSRTLRHNNALAVEAIIQRLPAFDNGCFIPGSLQEFMPTQEKGG